MSAPRIELGTLGMLASLSHLYTTTLFRQAPEKCDYLRRPTVTSIIDDPVPIPKLSVNLQEK